MKSDAVLCLIVVVSLVTFAIQNATGQAASQEPKRFELWKFDETAGTCRAKGRLQDKEYCDSRIVDEVIAQGKAAIPILISQITDTRRTPSPIYDFWDYTTAGDVAVFLLTNLFTDSGWKTLHMPGLEALEDNCSDPAWVCWHRFVTRHGRSFIRNQWLAAWKANKDRIYWSEEARCFRLSPKATTK